MRTSLLIGFLGLSLTGCVGVIDGGAGGGGGDDVGDDGSGSGSDEPDPVPTPRLDSTIDKTTVATELGTTSEFKITLTGSGDFAGAVTVTPTVVDATNAPLAGWTITVDSPSVTLATNGTATVTGTLVIPTQNMGLLGTVKFDVGSSVGTESLTAAVTATNQVTLIVTQNGNGQCVYPTAPGSISVGSKIRFLNMGADNIIIHGDGIINHQNAGGPGIATNTAYELTMNNTGNGSWYCHSPGPSTDQPINVVQ